MITLSVGEALTLGVTIFSLGVTVGFRLADKKVTPIDDTCTLAGFEGPEKIKLIYVNDKLKDVVCKHKINKKDCAYTQIECSKLSKL